VAALVASEAVPALAPAAGLEAACVGNEKEEEDDVDTDADAEAEAEDEEGVPAGCAEAVRGRERALASTCGNLSARAESVDQKQN
jgi:hypothetical protein